MQKIKSLENVNENPQFVKDSEGAERLRVSIFTFRRLADEFGCSYKVGRSRVTDWMDFQAKFKEKCKLEKKGTEKQENLC